MKRGDYIIIVLVMVLAGSILGMKWIKSGNEHYGPGDLQAVITINGKVYKTVALKKEEQVIEIQTKFGHNILKAYDYGIRMTYSDAPLPIALDMGFISKPRQQIICIPARLMVEIVNPRSSIDDDEGIDAVI